MSLVDGFSMGELSLDGIDVDSPNIVLLVGDFVGICPFCRRQDLRSKVLYKITSPLSRDVCYYDEDGHHHSHDPSVTTISFECTNTHKGTVHYTRNACMARDCEAIRPKTMWLLENSETDGGKFT